MPSGVALAVFVSRLSVPVTMLTLLAVKLCVPQVAVPVAAQLRPVTVNPAGSVSVTLAPVTLLGPLFHTRMVYVTVPPLPTATGPLLLIARSAAGVTVVFTLDVLLPVVASVMPDGAVTVAVFVNVPVVVAVP